MAEMSNRPLNEASSHRSYKGRPVSSSSSYARRNAARQMQASGQQGMGLRFVISALRQWWKLATPVGLLLAVAAGAYVYLMHDPLYQASAWLKIEASTPRIVFDANLNSRHFVANQRELMRSPLVIGPVLADENVARDPEIATAPDPISHIQSRIKVGSVGGSEYYKVSYLGKDPVHSANIVTAVINAYFQLRGKENAEQAQKVIELLEQEKDRRSLEVGRLREQVREMAMDATGKDPFIGAVAEAPVPAIDRPLLELQTRLADTQVEIEMLEAQVEVFKQLDENHQVQVPQGAVVQAVNEHPEIVAIQTALASKEEQLKQYKNTLGDEHAWTVNLEADIAKDRTAMQERMEELGQEAQKQLHVALVQERKQELARMESQLETYRLMAEALRARSDVELEQVTEATGETLDLQFKRSELDQATQTLQAIATRINQLRTEQRAPGRVSLVQKATPPASPVELVPTKKITVVCLFAFLAPFGLAVLWERLIRRVSDADQLSKDTNLEVVGEVARLPVRTSTIRGGTRMGQGIHVYEESIDSLRTSLVLSEPLKDMQVLVVTSARNSEGKTSVAVQLAVSIARASGKPTLLVDGDMRAPDVHRLLDIDLAPGLSDVLAGDTSLDEAIRTDWSDYVHILPAGKALASPHKLLGNGSLRPLLDTIRDSYRYVVIDTPPVLAAAEALVLAKNADASLICAMRDVSRVDQVRRTYDRLMSADANPVGVVLNGIPTRRYAYRYGGYGYVPREYATADSHVNGNGVSETAENNHEDTPVEAGSDNE